MKDPTTTKSNRKAIKALKAKHVEDVMIERRGYYGRRDRARAEPWKYMSLIVDGADQSAYNLPHFVNMHKEITGQGLKVKIVGVKEHDREDRNTLFILTEEFETGANHVIESIHRALELRAEYSVIPEILFIQVDNTTRENKNRYFMSYVESLVAWGVVKEAQVSFLPVGHTHEDIDQLFSRTSIHFKTHAAHSMEEMMEGLRKCISPTPQVSAMKNMINWSGLVEKLDVLTGIEGFSDYRFFKFFRNGGARRTIHETFSTACHVKVREEDTFAPLENHTGFIKRAPKLINAPDLIVKCPDTYDEVTRYIETSKATVRDQRIHDSLIRLRDEIFCARNQPCDWNFQKCIELNGRFKEAREGADAREIFGSVHDGPVEELDYEGKKMVVVRAPPDDTDLFWIARITNVIKNYQGKPSTLDVEWYASCSGQGEDVQPIRKKYSPALDSKGRILSDKISVNTVMAYFLELKRDDTIPKTVRTIISSSLGNF